MFASTVAGIKDNGQQKITKLWIQQRNRLLVSQLIFYIVIKKIFSNGFLEDHKKTKKLLKVCKNIRKFPRFDATTQ